MIWLIVKIAIVLIILLLIYGFASNYFITTEKYCITVENTNEKELPIRIVMLADLHGSRFGKDNNHLIQMIHQQSPDLICVAGDMTVKNGMGIEECMALCYELMKICPVYYAPGNHEIRMPQWETYGKRLKQLGVNWLDNQQMSLMIRGKKLHICGLDLPEDWYHKFWKKCNFTVTDMRDMIGNAPTDGYTVLLAHNPEYFETYAKWGADLVCAGHVHGGIARLPILGGVIDPSLRLFPKYDAGRFEIDSSVMILTRGLGTHHIRLRFFNVPEISVIDLHL
nr:metallophosphoesterase [Eubacterium sp.]